MKTSLLGLILILVKGNLSLTEEDARKELSQFCIEDKGKFIENFKKTIGYEDFGTSPYFVAVVGKKGKLFMDSLPSSDEFTSVP